MANESSTLRVSLSHTSINNDPSLIVISLCFYMAGKSAMKALLSPAYQKTAKVPKVENEEQAQALMTKILPQ